MQYHNISNDAKLEFAEKDGVIKMNWLGIIDTQDTNKSVGEFLAKYHTDCIDQKISKLESNFTNLEYMNSSGIKNIINWIRAIVQDNGYTITIIYDKENTWQQVTFSTIKMMIQNIELIEDRRKV